MGERDIKEQLGASGGLSRNDLWDKRAAGRRGRERTNEQESLEEEDESLSKSLDASPKSRGVGAENYFVNGKFLSQAPACQHSRGISSGHYRKFWFCKHQQIMFAMPEPANAEFNPKFCKKGVHLSINVGFMAT